MKDNKIIYEPDFIVSNPALLTSLCVYFDELILVSCDFLDEEEDKIKSRKPVGYQTKLEFIKHTLRPLLTEGVIKLYDSESIFDMVPNSMDIKLGDIDILHDEKGLILDIKSLQNNKIAYALYARIKQGNAKISDVLRLLAIYTLSTEYNIPVATFSPSQFIDKVNANTLADSLAIQTLCTFSLPQLYATKPEDIIDIRNTLKDELIEFKSGILDLTYLLYQTISMKPTKDIKEEMDFLINTKIKSSVISLEHKITTNKRKSFANIVLNGSKFILSGALLSSGLRNNVNILESGLSTLQSISDFNSSFGKPEDKIASYILEMNRILKP